MHKGLHNSGYDQFRRALVEARSSVGMTQIDLARKLGEGQDFVSKCERGVRRLDVVELRQWCRALGVPFVPFMQQLDKVLPGTKS